MKRKKQKWNKKITIQTRHTQKTNTALVTPETRYNMIQNECSKMSSLSVLMGWLLGWWIQFVSTNELEFISNTKNCDFIIRCTSSETFDPIEISCVLSSSRCMLDVLYPMTKKNRFYRCHNYNHLVFFSAKARKSNKIQLISNSTVETFEILQVN